MRKNRLLQVRLTAEEDEKLEALAQMTCLTKSSLVRQLIAGYQPKEKPDKELYALLKEMYSIGNNLNQLVAKAHSLGFIDKPKLDELLTRHKNLIVEVEQKYIKPERSDEIWQ